jgi:hypothetical protein
MIANLPPDVRAQIQDTYAEGQITVLPLPYWSTVRFAATRAGGPPVSFSVAAGERKAFAYAIGQSLQIAGFAAAYGNATEAETNLLRQSETRDNADFWIWGVACSISHDSEPALARRIWRETSVRISLNGTTQIPLGRLEMFPGAGGLFGASPSYIKSPDLSTAGAVDNGIGAVMPFLANGNPMAGNFFRLNQPFKWASVGNSGADSSLILSFNLQRAFTETSPLVRAGVAAGTPNYAAGSFTPPLADGDPGTFVDIVTHLIGVSVAKRSVNV